MIPVFHGLLTYVNNPPDMKVKISTNGKFHAITVLEPVLAANMTAALEDLCKPFLQQEVKTPPETEACLCRRERSARAAVRGVLQDPGLKEYASTPGNRGVWVLRRVFDGQGRVHLDHAPRVMGCDQGLCWC